MITRDKKVKIIAAAEAAESDRKINGWTEDETIAAFIEQMKQQRISSAGWFEVDEVIRKNYEKYSWFWIIRSVRNNLDTYRW